MPPSQQESSVISSSMPLAWWLWCLVPPLLVIQAAWEPNWLVWLPALQRESLVGTLTLLTTVLALVMTTSIPRRLRIRDLWWRVIAPIISFSSVVGASALLLAALELPDSSPGPNLDFQVVWLSSMFEGVTAAGIIVGARACRASVDIACLAGLLLLILPRTLELAGWVHASEMQPLKGSLYMLVMIGLLGWLIWAVLYAMRRIRHKLRGRWPAGIRKPLFASRPAKGGDT